MGLPGKGGKPDLYRGDAFVQRSHNLAPLKEANRYSLIKRNKPMPQSRWSVARTLLSLKAIPAPLTSPDEADAFNDAVGMVQDAPRSAQKDSFARAASDEIIRVVRATLDAPRPKRFADEMLFGLKNLAYLSTREGMSTILYAARLPLDPDAYLWTTALAPFGRGHPGAPAVFKALSQPLPRGFMAICLLDAANKACREHGHKKHPFDSVVGQQRLREYLTSTDPDKSSYAVSACAALPFLSPKRRNPLFALARKHKDPSIRLEVAWAQAKLGNKVGFNDLAAACLNHNQSRQACTYLKELRKASLIPAAAKDPDFAALSEMCDWLAHPNEFGAPPDRITQIDKRRIYWPPTCNERTVRLFKYEYKNRGDRKKEIGIGMVGSITFALFGESTARMKPEEVYGLHCAWELEGNDDPRAPRKRTGKAGWKLIQQRA